MIRSLWISSSQVRVKKPDSYSELYDGSFQLLKSWSLVGSLQQELQAFFWGGRVVFTSPGIVG